MPNACLSQYNCSSSRHKLRDDQLGRHGERRIQRHADVQSIRPPKAGDQVEERGRAGVCRLGKEGHQEERLVLAVTYIFTCDLIK